MLATTEPVAGLLLPDLTRCTTPRGEREGEKQAALAVKHLPWEEARCTGAAVRLEAREVMPAVLLALQARDQPLLAAALRQGAAAKRAEEGPAERPAQGGRGSSVAGTESIWLALGQQPPNLAAVGLLLQHRTDPNRRLDCGVSALHFALYGRAADAEPQALLSALAVQALLAGKADPNVRGKPRHVWLAGADCEEREMVSALSAALAQHNWHAAAALVAAGAEVSEEDRRVMGEPLWRALSLREA